MRPPNLQFSDVSQACEALNIPLIAWPEDCGRYSWEEFPEINLYDCVEKYDLIHVAPVNGDTNPVSTRPGRAYATTFIDDILFFVTFEPRSAAAQSECADPDGDLDAAYLEGYGSGEERGFDRATLLAAQEWLKGWNAGIVDALDEPQTTDPDPIGEPMPDEPEPEPEWSQAIPEDELHQEEPKFLGPHGYGTPLPVLAGVDKFYVDEINTASPETEAVITAVTERDRQHNAETEEETSMSEVTQGPEESEFVFDENPEVCSPCERLTYMTKALEVNEIRVLAAAVLAPLAEALGEADIEIVQNLDDLFFRTEQVLLQLAKVEDLDARDILKAEFAALETEALTMQSKLASKLAALGA